MTDERDARDDIKRLVAHMHDGLCRCGGFCAGAENDLLAFEAFVEDRWGSTTPMRTYLEDIPTRGVGVSRNRGRDRWHTR